MKDRSGTHRMMAALATYWLTVGASFFLMFRFCERCSMDNAYLGEVLLGALSVVIGLLVTVSWLVAARREARRGLAAGGVAGIGVAAVIVVIGSTRTLVPPALFPMELLLLIVGGAATVAFAARRR